MSANKVVVMDFHNFIYKDVSLFFAQCSYSLSKSNSAIIRLHKEPKLQVVYLWIHTYRQFGRQFIRS